MLRFILGPFLAFSSVTADEKARVMGLGASTIDLLIQVDDPFVKQYTVGSKGGSCPTTPERIQMILKESGASVKTIAGGSAANTVRALSKLGERCSFLGHVGTDGYGDLFAESLKTSGVAQRLIKSPAHPTSQVLCMITPDGQRTFLGFDAKLNDVEICRQDFADVEWVHFEARRLCVGFCVDRAMRVAKESGAKVSLDLSCIEVVREHRESLRQLISNYVDVLFCNEDEMRMLVGMEPQEGCRELLKECPVVVVTLGAKGCLVGRGEEMYQIPPFEGPVVDTTGAGDYFAGGFLYGYLKKYPLETCAKIGNRLGSAIIGVIGADLPEEQWDSVHQFLKELL